MKLLRIDSSARENSISRQLTASFVESWRTQHPDGEVVERDLATTALPHITDEWVYAAYSEPTKLTVEQKQVLATSDTLIEELRQADTIVIGAPMYNFAIPAPLKAWIDQIVRVGQTVQFGASGPQGILRGKKAYVITSRGGAFRPGTPTERFDYQEPYLRHILAFIGLTDVTFIHAENQKPGAQAEIARSAAIAQIQQLTAGASISAAE
ncbi:MAG TPA: NAD(P)H-dependent oxidoreductase [Candidatus Dormibacteraeota bacterium]|nr:NAD(P)H-dependent oxidoreductase [Candidatus Dormibacteraeota bacterium]